MRVHEATRREIVNPRKFDEKFRPEEEAREKLKNLEIDQLEDLMRGLKVKARGSHQLLRFGPRRMPGPGSYDPHPKHSKAMGVAAPAPIMMRDYRPGMRFDVANKEVPGPGTYMAQTGAQSTIPSPPKCSMHKRLPDKIVEGSRRNKYPGPGSYVPFPAFGSGGKQFSMYDRSMYIQKGIVPQSPGPGAYVLPPTTLKGNTVQDWSPRSSGSIHQNSGPVDCLGMAELSERRAYRPGKLQGQVSLSPQRKTHSSRGPRPPPQRSLKMEEGSENKDQEQTQRPQTSR